ncbi:reverse transcriptase domain-containing protein [Tanacetum coccineum]
MARMEERLDQFVDKLADRINDMMNPRRRRDDNSRGSEDEESENPFFGGGGLSSDEEPDRPRRDQREDNRLQNLKQGTKSVEDYTTEFYQLIARNDIQETEYQLVSRYIGGLRAQIMDAVNMFDPVTLSDAYQRGISGSGNVTSRFVPNQTKVGGGNTGPVSKGVGSSGVKCFNCGEPDHRQSECKQAGKRHLFVDEEWEDNGVADDEYEEPPMFDDDQYEEELDELEMGDDVFVLIGKEVAKDSEIPAYLRNFLMFSLMSCLIDCHL